MHIKFELKENPAETVILVNRYRHKAVYDGRLVNTTMVEFACADGSIGSMDALTFRDFYRVCKD